MKRKASFIIAVASLSLFILLGGLSLALFNAPVAGAQSGTSAGSDLPRTITVVGEGKVSVAPDMAQVNIGVETVGPDVKQASSEAAKVMEDLLSALANQGVANTDIQTSYYNIWVERPYVEGASSGEAIYHVNNNVAVTVRNLNNLATVLSAAIDAGANTVNSIDFKVAEPSQLRADARQKAVDDALATAQELAGLNDVEVGQVVSISEVIGNGAFFMSEFSMAQGMGGGGGVGPISPGEVEVSVQLQVTYALK